MLKRDIVKAVYGELRASSAGTGVAAIDLLRLAQHIVKVYTDPDSAYEESERVVEFRGFHQLSVDEAMRDGGWRVLEFETPGMNMYGDASITDITLRRYRIERFLGPEWRHPPLMGQL